MKIYKIDKIYFTELGKAIDFAQELTREDCKQEWLAGGETHDLNDIRMDAIRSPQEIITVVASIPLRGRTYNVSNWDVEVIETKD